MRGRSVFALRSDMTYPQLAELSISGLKEATLASQEPELVPVNGRLIGWHGIEDGYEGMRDKPFAYASGIRS